jgi:uncharacterized protein (DUF1697 family)
VTRRIALLRAVNVGGRTALPMAELRKVLAGLGLKGVQTLLQSGNAVFAGGGKAADLESRIEAELKRALKVESDVLIRDAAAWRAMIAANPYPEMAQSDPGHLLVFALKEAPASAAVEKLRAAIVGRETLEARGRELFITYPDGIGRSKLTNTLIEKTLGLRGTGRNWNTVMKLAALVED